MLVALAALATAAGAVAATVWDGVYTEAQASRGQALFQSQCAPCHGEPAKGTPLGPALSGEDFLLTYEGKTASDLYDKILKTMPSDDPGKLQPAQAADLMTYIFSANRWPAGQKELGTDPAELKQIQIVGKQPR
jgi:mono/diheme cytochrome c family protein